MSPNPFLSIIIPAFNEEDRLPIALGPVKEYLEKQSYTWQIVLVDDGSGDRTSEILNDMLPPEKLRVVRYEKNKGKGYAVRQGVFAADGEVLLISDADFSTPIKEFKKLHAFLDQGFDLVIGSRSLPDSQVTKRQAWYRQGMGRIFNKLVQCVALKGFVDTQCGFKCFRREVGESIFRKMLIDRFSFDVELLFVAQKWNLKIKEVPVEWENVDFSRVNVIKDSSRMLWDLFVIRANDMLGKYKR